MRFHHVLISYDVLMVCVMRIQIRRVSMYYFILYQSEKYRTYWPVVYYYDTSIISHLILWSKTEKKFVQTHLQYFTFMITINRIRLDSFTDNKFEMKPDSRFRFRFVGLLLFSRNSVCSVNPIFFCLFSFFLSDSHSLSLSLTLIPFSLFLCV